VYVFTGDAASPQEVHAEKHGVMPLMHAKQFFLVNGWHRHLATDEAVVFSKMMLLEFFVLSLC
jgi:hypothetical protein